MTLLENGFVIVDNLVRRNCIGSALLHPISCCIPAVPSVKFLLGMRRAPGVEVKRKGASVNIWSEPSIA